MGYGRYDMLQDVPIMAGLDKTKYDEYLAMATIDRIDDFKIYFLHYNHLLENKKATNRIKDQLDVQELERINKKP